MGRLLLVQAEGLEPPTSRLEGGHSIRLSYTRMWRKQEDSNPQAVSRVGFLDRCATNYALCFRVWWEQQDSNLQPPD